MTFEINEYWGVTVSPANIMGPNFWEARAWVFRRDNFKKIGPPHIGSGLTMDLADSDALRIAKQFIVTLDNPKNWMKQ
jgi:hypothetical protein